MTTIEIRELRTEHEWLDAFPVVEQLRTHLDEERYLEYLHHMSTSGYRLFGLFADGELATVAGASIETNMYYGRHLWVFELVTDADHRSNGYGEQLFDHLLEWAESKGCEKIALSSGLERAAAHRFYEERVDMERASYVFTLDL